MYYTGKPEYTYEEIRNQALEMLSVYSKDTYYQFKTFKNWVGSRLSEKKKGITPSPFEEAFSDDDGDIFLEVFWDMFRQGIITLGSDHMNPDFPNFRVSAHGKTLLNNGELYFYPSNSSYVSLVKKQIPNIDDITLDYLKESLQSFYNGCYLSSSVMLGVASEHTFLLLLDKVENNPNYCNDFQKALKEWNISRKFTHFKNTLDLLISQNKVNLKPEVKENLDTNFGGILNTIRYFRNESGHPSGNRIDRDQCYANLLIFIQYCKKAYQLIDEF
jgi:hypothetical protein